VSEPEPEPDDTSVEVTVYGEVLVEQARQEVVHELADLGYDAEVLDRGDRVVYRHAAPWKGEVVLFDDGYMQVKRQPLRVEGREVPWADANTPVAWAGCLVYPWACVRVNGALYSQRRWRQVEDQTVRRVQPRAETWGDRVADLAVDRKVEDLPERLEALWASGTPVDGGAPLATPAERRAALLAYWGSRTETPWGETVRRSVESFCRAVVQRSEHPFTDAELEAFNTGRLAVGLRPFDLTRRTDDAP
jgi:hypothetical protein